MGPIVEDSNSVTGLLEKQMADLTKMICQPEAKAEHVKALNMAAQNQKFAQDMAKAQVESMKNTAAMTGNKPELARLRRSIAEAEQKMKMM